MTTVRIYLLFLTSLLVIQDPFSPTSRGGKEKQRVVGMDVI